MDVFGTAGIDSDAFGHVQTRLDMLGRVGMPVTFVLNAGEATDKNVLSHVAGPPKFKKIVLSSMYIIAGLAGKHWKTVSRFIVFSFCFSKFEFRICLTTLAPNMHKLKCRGARDLRADKVSAQHDAWYTKKMKTKYDVFCCFCCFFEELQIFGVYCSWHYIALDAPIISSV